MLKYSIFCVYFIDLDPLLRIKGDNSLAKKYALQAINLDYYDYLAYKILAEINLAQNNYEEFYKNFKIFLNKKPSGLHCKNIEASIYNKVKNDEKFDMLIKESNKNILTLNELNITVDHNSLMSYKSYKKQRIIYFLKISLVCLLLFISVYFILNT